MPDVGEILHIIQQKLLISEELLSVRCIGKNEYVRID